MVGCYSFGARDGNRTRTVSHTPLKRARLPVPPLPQNIVYYITFFRFVNTF